MTEASSSCVLLSFGIVTRCGLVDCGGESELTVMSIRMSQGLVIAPRHTFQRDRGTTDTINACMTGLSGEHMDILEGSRTLLYMLYLPTPPQYVNTHQSSAVQLQCDGAGKNLLY